MASPSPTPPIPAPSGKVTEFQAVNDLWKWNVLCQTACLVFPAIALILRTYIRLCIKGVWILEDYMCCLAFAGLAVYSGLLTTIISMHGGIHEWDMTTSEVITILYYVNVVQIWYNIAAACIKTTILLLYLRVFSPRRWSQFDLTIRGFTIILCAFYFAISIAKLCQCLPRARIWDKSVQGTCLNLPALLDTCGLFNIISDTCILLVPLKGIWRLQMDRKRKIGVYAVFTVGTIAPVFSTVGFVMRFTLASGMDQSYNQPLILLWATAELATGVMIICFPTLPGIFQGRSRKPTMSIVNGTANRVESMRLYHHTMHANGDYYKLGDERQHELRIRMPEQAIINDIRGGSSEDDDNYSSCMLGLKTDANTMPDGIVKMTKIEQTDSEEMKAVV